MNLWTCGRLTVAGFVGATGVMTGRVAAASIDLDTTATPSVISFFNPSPGVVADQPEAFLDTPLNGLAAGQQYHLTIHVADGKAFQLDPGTANVDVILYSQNRASSNGSTSIATAGVGTAELAGPNIKTQPIQLDLVNQYASPTDRVGVTVQGGTTYDQAKIDPSQAGLVTDLTIDFTLPSDFSPTPNRPLNLLSVALLATEPDPGNQPPTSFPTFAGFASVPEPGSLALAAGALLLMRRGPRRAESL